jgi:SecD/SecF fusion protein
MQNKGAISFFAILLAVICLFELSFTFVVSSVERNAAAYAAGDPEKEREYLDSIAGQPVYNIILKQYTYKECKEKELNLGLDLKGGMNVTLEVSVPDVVRSLSNYSTDPTFTKAMELAINNRRGSSQDFLTLFNEAVTQIDPNARLSSPSFFGHKDMKDRINSKMTNAEVLEVVRENVNSSIDNSYIVIRNRIDKFGVSQPNIQRLEASGRILVELPGVKDPERVRKLLQGAAKLEFWETYENKDVYPFLEKANERLREVNKLDKGDATPSVDSTDKKEELSNELAELLKDNKDTTELSLEEKLAAADSTGKDSLSQEKQFADFQKNNPLLGILQPFVNQTEQGTFFVPGPCVGLAFIRDTTKINKMLANPQVKEFFPKDLRFFWAVKPYDKAGTMLQLIAVRTTRDGKAPLTGDVITNAFKQFGQLNGKPEVSMSMNAEGATKWKRLTAENIDKSIAIVLDDFVYSYPTVQGEIAGGSSQITGNFTIKEAEDLANILNSGKMDAPARIVEEAIVGPSLGQEAIKAGLYSALAGLILVFLFMAFYYSTAGLVADIALFANIFFLMGVMASLGAVLTLPGIAGIVLTLGMSVDANVLIYERIREELNAGKGIKTAVADGYKNAYSAIIDSNVTTLLTGVILYTFGTGPIQGFATTLVIGILTSLFSAIFISRLVFENLLSKNKNIKFSIPATANILTKSNFDFIGKRKTFYVLSLIFVLIGAGSIVFKGFGYGVDFKGGRSYVLRFDQPVSSVQAREILASEFGQAPDVKTFGTSNQIKVTTSYLIENDEIATDSIVENKILDRLSSLQGSAPEIMSSQKVGPTIASDIKQSAVLAIIFSLLVLFLYLMIRFRKWHYGLGAIGGLVYVVIFILGAFSLLNGILPFSLDIDQAFIAAILTVVGYAINDSVVIFDRIREYITLHASKKEDITGVINNALNSTLSRTLVTSLTTIIVLLVLFIFGGEVIRGFIFAMLLGVIVGTYSSLFVAAPIVADLSLRISKKGLKDTEKK